MLIQCIIYNTQFSIKLLAIQKKKKTGKHDTQREKGSQHLVIPNGPNVVHRNQSSYYKGLKCVQRTKGNSSLNAQTDKESQ